MINSSKINDSAFKPIGLNERFYSLYFFLNSWFDYASGLNSIILYAEL